MLSHSKTPLRASQRKEQQRLKLRRQARIRSGILLVIIIVACFVDFIFLSRDTNGGSLANLTIARSVAVGALLNWIAQTVFTSFVFRYTGAQARHNIVGQLYLGQIVKWVIVIVGFSIIFMTIKPLSAAAVITGFILMQIGHFITLWQSR